MHMHINCMYAQKPNFRGSQHILLPFYIIDVVSTLSYYADYIFKKLSKACIVITFFTTVGMSASDPTWPSYESFVNKAEFILS